VNGRRRGQLAVNRLLLAVLLCLPVLPALAQRSDSYAQMLGYLTASHVDGQVLAGAQGSIKLNLAAGDLNSQHNAHSLAIAEQANAGVDSRQSRQSNRYQGPSDAVARIDGQVLSSGSGVASVNQVAGSGNDQLNSVAAAVGKQARLHWSDTPTPRAPPLRSAAMGVRRAELGAAALQGFEGVVQLNQIAGSANLAENRLGLLVQTGP
jgi:hypothetical protein